MPPAPNWPPEGDRQWQRSDPLAQPGGAFAANGHLGTPASVTSGFKPALAACAGLALLATLSSTAITSPADEPIPGPGARELSITD